MGTAEERAACTAGLKHNHPREEKKGLSDEPQRNFFKNDASHIRQVLRRTNLGDVQQRLTGSDCDDLLFYARFSVIVTKRKGKMPRKYAARHPRLEIN